MFGGGSSKICDFCIKSTRPLFRVSWVNVGGEMADDLSKQWRITKRARRYSLRLLV